MDQMPNRIRELRKARGLYLEQLATKVGCSVTFMSDLERGVRDLGHVWMLRIAKALKVEVADLLNENENSKSLNADQRQLLDLWSKADADQRAQLLQMAKIILTPKPKGKAA